MGLGKALCITGIVILVIGIILMIALIVSSYETVEQNQVGLDYDTTTMQLDETTLYDTGRYFIGVSHNFIIFRTDLQTINITDVACRSQDGLIINISVTFQFRLLSQLQNVLELAYLFPEEAYLPAYVVICRNVFRDATSRYEVFAFLNNRTQIESDLRYSTQDALAKYGAQVENFQLIDIQYPADFQDAISLTQNAILSIQTAQFNLTKAQQQVKGLIAQAKTQTQVIINQANTTSFQLSQQAQGISSAMNQRISALTDSLAIFANNTQIKDKSNFLINYQWIQSIQNVQNQQIIPLPIRLSMPKSFQCLYDNTKC